MLLIHQTMFRNPRAREILDPNRSLHQRLDNSRRDRTKRRETKGQENQLKERHNPSQLLHLNLLHPLSQTLLHQKQGEVVIPIDQRKGCPAPSRSNVAEGCVNGNNCPFQHANDPVTKKPLAPSLEDVERYQAALKRNPSLANPKPASSSGANKSSSSVPTIR